MGARDRIVIERAWHNYWALGFRIQVDESSFTAEFNMFHKRALHRATRNNQLSTTIICDYEAVHAANISTNAASRQSSTVYLLALPTHLRNGLLQGCAHPPGMTQAPQSVANR